MHYRQLGRTGLKVSVLGFGANQIGRPEVEERTVEAVLNRAVELGINFFDTAAMYKRSEERLGRYLQRHRDQVLLATKCGDYSVFENGTFRTVKDYTRAGILKTIENSRRKLRTDRIDVIQFHGLPGNRDQRQEAIEALREARDKGWVSVIGASIDEPPGADDDLWQPDVMEFSYSILHQEAAATILPVTSARGMGTIIKCPIANAVYLMPTRPEGTYYAGSWDRAQKLDVRALAGDLDPTAFALRFTLSHPGVHTAIVGTTRVQNLEANAAACEAGPLEAERVERAREQFASLAARKVWG